jgi:hypothetical protein
MIGADGSGAATAGCCAKEDAANTANTQRTLVIDRIIRIVNSTFRNITTLNNRGQSLELKSILVGILTAIPYP